MLLLSASLLFGWGDPSQSFETSVAVCDSLWQTLGQEPQRVYYRREREEAIADDTLLQKTIVILCAMVKKDLVDTSECVVTNIGCTWRDLWGVLAIAHRALQ
jgi:hypothetical protein